MSENLTRALDILAGVAGQEMEKARQFEDAQTQRMQALAELNRQFELQMKKIKLGEEQFEYKKGQDLISNTINAAAKTAEIKRKTEQDYQDKFGAVLDAEKEYREAWEAGADEETMGAYKEQVNIARQRLGLKEDYAPQFDESLREKKGMTIKIDPFSQAYLGTLGRKTAEEEIKFGKIEPMLNAVGDMFLALEPGEGVGGKFEQWIKSNLAFSGAYPEYKSYDDVVSGMAVQTARMLGDVGNIAVAEREINEKMLPQSTDTKEEGLKKLEKFKVLVNAIQNGNMKKVKSILNNYGIKYYSTNKSNANFTTVFGDSLTTEDEEYRKSLENKGQ